MELNVIVWEGVDCITLPQVRGQWWAVVSTAMNVKIS
jgi:hypothetical protein